MNWRRLLCLFGHAWSAPINIGSVSIQGGKVSVSYYRRHGQDSQRLRRTVDIEDNNIMISFLVCARCEHTKLKHETNLPVVRRAE